MKMRAPKLCLLATICLAGAACVDSLPSDPPASTWTLIDDFEQQDLQGWTKFDAQNETDPFVPDAQVHITQAEANADNHYLLRKPAIDGVVGNRKALAWRELPRAVPTGAKATFFTRINVEYFPNNHSFGLTNQPPQQIGTLAYDAFEPMIRITDKAETNGTVNDGALQVLKGRKAYAPIRNPATGRAARPLEPGVWYEVWFVVDNARHDEGGQSYDLHIRGGEFAARTKVYQGAQFRMAREQALTHFIAISNTGPARAPYGNGGVRFDDIYMADGINLSSPPMR